MIEGSVDDLAGAKRCNGLLGRSGVIPAWRSRARIVEPEEHYYFFM